MDLLRPQTAIRLSARGHEAAITALAGCEIHGRDPKGKLIIVVDAPDTGSLGTTLNNISLLPHVHTASLVFHATEIG